MKNALLLCLSMITNVSKNTYIGEDGSRLEGFFTNEAPVKYVIQSLEKQNPPQKLDRVIIICSETVKKHGINVQIGKNDSIEVKSNKEEFLNKISKIKKEKGNSEPVTHLEYYKDVVKNAVGDEANIPEYTLIDIPDEPKGEEVAYSVIEAVKGILKFPEKEDIHLYIDYNGGPRYVSFMQVILAQFMKIHNVHIEAIYSMNYKERHTMEIKNLYSIFDSVNLLSCINEYINYGRIDGLMEYFGQAEDSKINDILKEMEILSNNLQLCRTSFILENGKRILEKLKSFISSVDDTSENENIYKQLFAFVVRDICEEYEDLLNGDLPKVIKWCINKKYIQQALTFCSEEIPLELWNKEILRASDEEEYYDFLNELDNITNGSGENVDSDLKDAVRNIRGYFSRCSRKKEVLKDRDVSYWLNHYILYCCTKSEYKKILFRIRKENKQQYFYNEKSNSFFKSIKNKIKEQGYLTEILKVTLNNNKFGNSVDNTAKVMLNYERARIKSKVKREELEEIVLIYYFLKEQRNATNHASASPISYLELCKILEYFVQRLEYLEKL